MLSGDASVAAGQSSVFFEMLTEFSKYVSKITLICPAPTKIMPNDSLPKNIELYPVGSHLLSRIWQTPLVAWKLAGVDRPDLVISHEFGLHYTGLTALMLKTRYSIPWLCEVFHIEGYPHPKSFSDRMFAGISLLFLKTVAKKADSIRYINQNEMGKLLDRTGHNHRKVLLPSQFVDTSVFYPKKTPTKYDFIWIGRLDSNKNWQQCVELVTRLSKTNSELKAVMVANGSNLDQLMRLRKELELEHQLQLLSFVPTREGLADLLRATKCLVITSHYEGGPRIASESLACATPVIATPVGLVPELIKPGHNGEIYDGSTSQLVDLTQKLITDHKLLASYRRGARATPVLTKQAAVKDYAKHCLSMIAKPLP